MVDREVPDPAMKRATAVVRFTRLAWLAVAAIPIGFIAAMALGEGLLAAQGFGPDGAPPMAILAAALPALTVMLIPDVAAVMFGLRARALGARSGLVATLIGVAAGTYALATNVFALMLG